ncbi:hypothetical protein BU25DRAFT_432172 [Macroventuria anomochaeta]|uniref:Uncharacterized protein n=1 Tax=Macroventuria anomochaeta TaxID=301207 RepID=A0ACB6RWL8_9PLEO|nr:uncharacterized protein BU25DRAFT_432172 [Macroventuria anomochaeta]KAF2626370.1 hypothetical protein BU25DRAFT_432172 [Macroventuria anomochaeta]
MPSIRCRNWHVLFNITIIAASATYGCVAVQKIIGTGSLLVQVLRRAGSTSKLPTSVTVIDIDYPSQDTLRPAFEGQDAVLSLVPTLTTESQITFIDAAASAVIRRLFPQNTVKVQEHMLKTARATRLNYTIIYNGAWLDAGAFSFFVNFSDTTTNIHDGGNVPISISTLDTIADALVGVVDHPEETENRSAYVHDMVTMQDHLLSVAKRVNPMKEWKTQDFNPDDLTARYNVGLAKGLLNMEAFLSVYDGTYNELLRSRGKTDDDLVEILKHILLRGP